MIAGRRPYPAYKDSGVEWLGEVPEHWETSKIKSLARPGHKTFVDGDWIESPYITSGGVRLIQTGNIGVGEYKEKGFRYISEETFKNFGCTEIEPGDVLICRLGEPVARACLAPQLGSRMITSVDVCILKLRDDTSAQFLVYSMSSCRYLDWVGSLVRGSTRDRVSRSMLGAFSVPIPPLPEQTAITHFLDYIDRRIQRYIQAKQKLITLLEEQKQAIIHQAVTGQIDVRTGQPYPAYKDSGVEWLGGVPEHWEARKLTWVARQETGHTPSRKVDAYWVPEECVIPWVSLADVWQLRSGEVVFIEETKEKVSEVGLANSSARLLPKDTVILSRTASVGFPAVLGAPMATTQDFAAWICGPALRPKFLYFVLLAMRSEFHRLMMGSTHQTIYMPDIRAFRTPLPSVNEQDEICANLEAVMQRIRQRSRAVQASIDLLNEYRTRLISDVVTGKLDVREAAARLPEADPLETEDDSADIYEPAEELEAIAEEVEA
ncbi:MAG: restriction endonuclease subunit S [Truepera sp.]|nr:restriction endonuclease subunit S [Truepera sp.]